MSKHTPGPWFVATNGRFKVAAITSTTGIYADQMPKDGSLTADARLIAAAPTQHAEMLRYLPVLERAEADSELWARLTDGLGIATLNGYRAAIKAVEEEA